jgi:nicotinate-nucleotide adenylyltransferase
MRLGVFGGTFDPPHLGHLILAAEAADQLALDRVLWVLTPNSPFKQGTGISPLEVRLELLQAAIADLPGHVFSDVEIRRPAPQYALDTILQLKQDYPGDALIYLVGGDSLRDLPRWHRPQELLEALDGLGVMRRQGARIDLPRLEGLLPGLTAKLLWVNAPLIQISASDIRQRLRQGRAYRFFVPEKVYQIIESRKLYR